MGWHLNKPADIIWSESDRHLKSFSHIWPSFEQTTLNTHTHSHRHTLWSHAYDVFAH